MIPRHPDPDRPLVADASAGNRFTANFGQNAGSGEGPIWAIVAMLCTAIARPGALSADQRIALYLSACDNLLNHNYVASGSPEELAIHRALARFAQLLAVRNA